MPLGTDCLCPPAPPPHRQVLAALHVLLLEARHQPAAAIAHGNRVVERLLRLHTKAGLELGHFADVVRPALARPHGWLGGWLDNLP